MNRRSLLSFAVLGTVAIGVAMTAIPFAKSMYVSAGRENAAWTTCDVSGLPAGEMMTCGYAMIYHRTENDKSMVAKYAHLLADPKSLASEQPSGALNPWRSEREDYFIFRPWAPVRHCGVELRKVPPHWWEPPELEALKELPYFTEPCEGRAWDMSGRLYQRKGYPPEMNLIVPKVKWVSESKVLVYGG